MTNWLPDLTRGTGPLYVRLADEIALAADNGQLGPGQKLPPQRNLAFDIGVTLGTVTRAYDLLKTRGLVSGEVGRGTFIRKGADEPAANGVSLRRYHGLATDDRPNVMTMNSTSAPEVGQARLIADILSRIATEDPRCVSDYIRHIPARWREAGRQWIGGRHWIPEAANVVPTQGAHAALAAVINAVTSSGDRIAFEELTYPATVRASVLMGRRAIKIGMGEGGVDPDAFEHLCAQQHPRLAILISTLHNPTLSTITLENRLRIVESARRHNVMLVDDDTFGAMAKDAPPPLSALAPERTFHVASLAKSIAAGLRSGFVACPPGHATMVMNAHRLITGGAPRAMIEVASRIILDGHADEISAAVRQDLGERVGLARDMLSGHQVASSPDCPFIWLRLPDPWVTGTFCTAARQRGVIVDGADEFKVGQTERAIPFVRIALTGALEKGRVRDGLSVLADLLRKPELAYDTTE